jgi:flagellar basal body-associated protein FliL
MGYYWLPILLAALAVVLLLGLVVVVFAHVRRFTHTAERARVRTAAALEPLTRAATSLKTRRRAA